MSIYLIFMKYFYIINFITFIIFSLDKYYAKKQINRVPEQLLLFLNLIGGSFGALIGMVMFHHKTSKNIFNKLVPITALIYLCLLYYFLMII